MLDAVSTRQPRNKLPQANSDLVPDPSKDRQYFLFRTGCFGGVVKAPVDTLCFAGENGTAFFGVVADGDDVIKLLSEKFIYRFRAMVCNVYPDLIHRGDRLRPHKALDDAGAFNFKPVAAIMPQKPLGHLASSAVAGAQDKDANFFCHIYYFSLS